MALNKFTWQNGTQVEPAKVEIDGVSYDVTDAQYEGETPLSASNLNLMQDTLLGNVTDNLDDDTKIPNVKAVKDIYSTTEVKTNKVYIENGVKKPIYRSKVKVTLPSFPSSYSEKTVAHGIANIDTVVGWDKFLISAASSDEPYGYLPFMHSSGKMTVIKIIDDTNITLRSADLWNANSFNLEGYVEYTKNN